ncbi:hypothetical protein TDIS_0903 [Thermosulfurimonas dismutans]|uniref:Uncharacterized protein n=1 Tax=Thermosulfurimonas dismutans TaxID=999894 RepID=A0A179D4I6_9BACT|nr:hypothetical protein TDIS_0903 [Thermosulfurimonas dismutans]
MEAFDDFVVEAFEIVEKTKLYFCFLDRPSGLNPLFLKRKKALARHLI